MTQKPEQAPRKTCGACRHFRNDPAFLEQAFKGLSTLSSGYASVRMDDGLCSRHDRHITARSWCEAFEAREIS